MNFAVDRRGPASSGRTSGELRLRGTFIEVTESDSDDSPRASSDPGSVSHRSDDFFGAEKEYISFLPYSWSRQVGVSSAASMEGMEERLAEVAGDEEQRKGSLQQVNRNEGLSRELLERDDSLLQRPSFKELASTIQKATREMKLTLQSRRYNSMLSAIQEIPDQLDDALQRSTDTILTEVMDEVVAVREMICNSGLAAYHPSAEQQIEAIPDIVQEQFGVAQRHVRQQVDGLVQELEHKETCDEVMHEIQAMPSEVQDITREALQTAAEASRAQAQEHLKFALQGLPQFQKFEQAKTLNMPTAPADVLESSAQVAHDVVVGALEAAVSVVNEETIASNAAANQVVADALLRAKAGTLPDSKVLLGHLEQAATAGTVADEQKTDEASGICCTPSSSADAAAVSGAVVKKEDGILPNASRSDMGARPRRLSVGSPSCITLASEGSLGHPELCSRPCIYINDGNCVNGNACNFCHLPHPRRPVHLDKQHRDLLKDMVWDDIAAVVLPIIRTKAARLSLSEDSVEMIDSLSVAVRISAQKAPAGWRQKKMHGPLSSMSLRSLLSLLLKAAPTEAERKEVDNLTRRLREGSQRQASAAPLPPRTAKPVTYQ